MVSGADDDACDVNNPCTLSRAWAQQTDGDHFFIRVRRTGGTVEVPAPATSLSKEIDFAPYVEGDVDAVEGTLEFTGNFKIAPEGQFGLVLGKVQFEDITLEAGVRSKGIFAEGDGGASRTSITGTLTIPNGETVVFGEGLVVSRSLTLKGGMKAGKASRLRIEDQEGGRDGFLTVQSGATLRIDGVDLVVHVKGGFTVDGAIEDVTKETSHPILIAFLNTNDGEGTRGGAGPSVFLASHMYQPGSQGVTNADCKRIRGTGAIPAGIVAIAMGNICVDLKQVGPVTVAGSLSNDVHSGNSTTDLIFREDMIVDGDVAQWNDSRIVFEKTATIRGDVILRDGGTPYTNTDDYGEAGTAADSGVRVGWKVNDNKYTCEYLNKYRRDHAGRYGEFRTDHIPGVHFAGTAMIEGDLNVHSSTLTETTTGATADATQCAPRVLFMAPLAKTSGDREIALTSSIGGNLVVEDTVSFGGKGRVYLDSDSASTQDPTTNVITFSHRTSHSLRVGGDLAAGGKTLGMEYPATSNVDGMCMENDTKLSFGNHLVLTDAAESVVVGDATSGLTLDALVTLGDLRVEPGKGPLTVTTLHVGPDAELTASKDVKVIESLILQGELSGELDEASTIKRLTYGSRNTDLVKKAALQPTLEALSVQVGSGELRLEEGHKVENLGLCSGTLSLVDTESTTDSTLHVTDQITVQNGMLTKDLNDPGSLSTDIADATRETKSDRYLLKYITPGTREVKEGALEWSAPKDVEVDHPAAEVLVHGDRSLLGRMQIKRGTLTMDGGLSVGTSSLDRVNTTGTFPPNTLTDRYSLRVESAGEMHIKRHNVMVHGRLRINGGGKMRTGGGDVHVLGRVDGDGRYWTYSARVILLNVSGNAGSLHLGDGTLMLGPEVMAKQDGLTTIASRPIADMVLLGDFAAGMIRIPKGSKRTYLYTNRASGAHTFDLGTVTFDGTRTPGKGASNQNRTGTLYLGGNQRTATSAITFVVDSLSAMQGAVVTTGKKVEFTKEVHLRSAVISPYLNDSLVFGGDLKVSGGGQLYTTGNSGNLHIRIEGNFLQTAGTLPGTSPAVILNNGTTKTVKKDFRVSADASGYEGRTGSALVVHGNFHFAKKGNLNAKVEFKGEMSQEVMTSDSTVLHSVVVDNPKGLMLKSDVKQHRMAKLTLRQGKIHSMPMDSMFMWTVQNVQAEQELRGRSSAQTGSKCGADNDEACKGTILRGSRQSYIGGPVARHLLQGTAGDGSKSGGYLFPVGKEEGDQSRYRPLILQLPSDLNDTTAVTVSPVMVPDGEMPAWDNLTVPHAGGSLTLDVHAPIFWKIDLGEELPTNTNLRVAADGIRNVTDITGLRLVQWDCTWKNPKLAGRVPAQADASSFGINGYLNGVVNLTQEGIGLGSCAIFGIAANGTENPIDQADLSGGRAMVQFIHNVPLTSPIDLHLGDIRIGSGMQFRSATGYRPVRAGSHVLKIQPVGAPDEQEVTGTLSLNPNTNTVVIAHGSLAEPKLKMLDMRMTSSIANKAEVRLVHGSENLGAARVQVMDPADPMMPVMTLAGNLMLNEATRRYAALDPSVQVMQVKSADGAVEEFYELDLSGYGGQTLVLNLSGTKRDLTILGVDRNGKIVPVQIVTSAENEMAELPTEFALHGNYPNPFNPSTRIQFDLPENAQVQIQIVDMLGREVMVLPAQELEAGANRSVELQATSLASGTYLYRIMATGAEQRHVKTGRMTLVK